MFPIVHHELLDIHVATAYSNHQLPIDDLCVDFLLSECVVVASKSGDRDGAVESIDILCEELIHNVTLHSFVDLSTFAISFELVPDVLVPGLALFHLLPHLLQLLDQTYNLLLCDAILLHQRRNLLQVEVRVIGVEMLNLGEDFAHKVFFNSPCLVLDEEVVLLDLVDLILDILQLVLDTDHLFEQVDRIAVLVNQHLCDLALHSLI